MIIDSFCENLTDKVKKDCLRCEYLGIASFFEENINHYFFCCSTLKRVIKENIKVCPFKKKDTPDLKRDLEVQCALHDIIVPDFIKEL